MDEYKECSTGRKKTRLYWLIIGLGELPERMKEILEQGRSHVLLAHRPKFSFYGMFILAIGVRDIMAEGIFMARCIGKDTILGMPFLMVRECSIGPTRPVLTLDGRHWTC